MIPRSTRHAVATLLAAVGTLAAPALAHAASGASSTSGASGASGTSGASGGSGGSGGSGLSPSASPVSAPGATASSPLVGNGNATVTASGAGITVSSTATALLRNELTFSGTVPASDAGDAIEIERLGHETNWQWAPTAGSTVASNGGFSTTWLTNHIGAFSIRAIVQSASAHAAAVSPALSVIVYLPAVATWYGPGFYGQRLACGGRLRHSTLGVANRSLPCGTKVALMFQGRTITVPVVDRGPYANHASWDLTAATADALRISGTETIGAASLRPEPAT